MVDAINDRLLEDMQALAQLKGVPTGTEALTDTLNFVPADQVHLSCAVPAYYDHRFHDHFQAMLSSDPEFAGFSSATLGDLQANGQLLIRGGHGSPSQEQRIGDVPYIKVSDLRAGHREHFYPAEAVIALIESFKFPGSQHSSLVSRWLSDLVALFRSQIMQLLVQRDANLGINRKSRSRLRSRSVDVVSRVAIDVDEQIAIVTGSRQPNC